MGSFSIWHWLVVLAIAVLVFGTKRLKNAGKDVGEAIKGFKQGLADDEESPPARLRHESREIGARDAARNDEKPPR